MILDYIKTSFRNFRRYKGYTFINVLGLTIGITSTLLILVWIGDEMQVDKFHAKDSRLYQMMRNIHLAEGQVMTTEGIPQPVAPMLQSKYPEVDQVSIVSWDNNVLVKSKDIVFRESGRLVEPQFLEMFSFPFVAGSPDKAINELHTIVISETLAKKYFGSSQLAMGQILNVNNEQDYTVTGVFKDIDKRSSLQFDWLIPAEEYIKQNEWVRSWFNGGFRVMFTLKEGVDVATFSKKIEQEINDHTDHAADERLFIQKFSDRYLHSTYEGGVITGGRIDYIKLFSVIALFTIVIACVNFMNLVTARSVTRAKEVGLRKVLGAGKTGLGVQFLTESMVTSFIAVIFSVAIAYLLIPSFNQLTGKNIVFNFTDPWFIAVLAGLVLFTGLLSGSYPAFLMPSFKVTNSLKGTLKHSWGTQVFRKGLVVFQFCISILLIIGSIVIYRQMGYIMNKHLGLDKENLLFLQNEGELAKHFDNYRSELQNIPEVKQVTTSSGNPLSYGRSSSSPSWRGKDPNTEVEMNILTVGQNFIASMGMEMLKGSTFSDSPSDSSSFIINEEAARIMGFENPVGEELSCWGVDGQIIGVVKNFHMSTLYEPIAPLVVRYAPNQTSLVFIRIQGDTQAALKAIEKVTTTINPGYPFTYNFLDLAYAENYQGEKTISTLTGVFATMAVIISCLGLLGLASFSAQQRTREIGIRKIHGASVGNILVLLSKGYTVLILVAFIISAPLAWFVSNQWLNRFTFRTNLTPMEFIVAGALTLVVAAVTIMFRSLRAATTNPVNTLREE